MRKGLIYVMMAFIIFGCEKEEHEIPYRKITGSYKLVKAVKYERVVDDFGRRDVSINLMTNCNRKNTLEIKSNGRFEIVDYVMEDQDCDPEVLTGTWKVTGSFYEDFRGDFILRDSNFTYEAFAQGDNEGKATEIDLTYGSILDDPSGRFIFTYRRTDFKNYEI